MSKTHYRQPSIEKAAGAFQSGYVVPRVRRISYQDPFDCYQRVYGNKPTAFLDSGRYQMETATHSYICLNPFKQHRFSGRTGPFQSLRHIFHSYKTKQWKGLPPFTGGAVGFLSYDLFRALERVRVKRQAELTVPKICMVFFRDVIAFDHANREAFLIANLLPEQDKNYDTALTLADKRLDAIEQALKAAPKTIDAKFSIQHFQARSTREQFLKRVETAKGYIKSGDIYQVNLSQRFSFDFKGEHLSLYARMREINPAPFSAVIDFGDTKVLSSSPERLVRLRNGECETRPIAGTRPAGSRPNETRRYQRELLLSRKERAEHLMLVDLERNDLGRVCDFNSVRVHELMTVEKYSHVLHIVSDVRGSLQSSKDKFDLLKSMFPGGTITGCPKVRSMEIIDELEGEPRELYTGSIGYIDFNGNMDWNIIIRTLAFNGAKGNLRVGAGIVHDSRPEREYAETLHKAKAFFEALGVDSDTF